MSVTLALTALLVRDYDEAIAFYCGPLGFRLIEDSDLGDGKRWVRIAPTDDAAFCLLLAKAANPRQIEAVGDQHGGREERESEPGRRWRGAQTCFAHCRRTSRHRPTLRDAATRGQRR